LDVRKLMVRLGGPDVRLRVAYEAGPTGYALHRQLATLDIDCMVVAPSLIPVRAGDKVKTDRRDALKLARLLRSGDLTAVWVPDEAHEALRSLVHSVDSRKPSPTSISSLCPSARTRSRTRQHHRFSSRRMLKWTPSAHR
jgi:transposase